jgi:hypothetical protein
MSKILAMLCGSEPGQYIMPHSARIWPELNDKYFHAFGGASIQ